MNYIRTRPGIVMRRLGNTLATKSVVRKILSKVRKELISSPSRPVSHIFLFDDLIFSDKYPACGTTPNSSKFFET